MAQVLSEATTAKSPGKSLKLFDGGASLAWLLCQRTLSGLPGTVLSVEGGVDCAGGWATLLPHVRWSTSLLVGGLLVGWSSFNVVEGIVDHHLLGLHHVKEGSNNLLAWDLRFLAWGAIMLVGGLALMRKGDRETGREPAAATR